MNESIQKKESKKDESSALVFDMVKNMETKLEEEAKLQKQKQEETATSDRKDDKKEEKLVSAEWCDDEIKLLVKGLKIIPVGTRERYI